jgi:hypothetical protein
MLQSGAVDADDTGVVVASQQLSPGVGAVVALEAPSGVGDSWTSVTLRPPDGTWFLWGRSVGRDADRIAVGAPARLVESQFLGGVAVFVRAGAGWSIESMIQGPAPGVGFGLSLAMSGDTLVVGAPTATIGGTADAGRVYVYRWIGTEWIETQILTADPPKPGERFGTSLALDGNRLVVGAPASDRSGIPQSGAAWVFESTSGAGSPPQFTQAALLVVSNPASGDALGQSVALAGDTVGVGVPGLDAAGVDKGGVLAASRTSKGGWESALLLPPAQTGVQFGTSVAARADRVIAVGANGPDAVGYLRSGEDWSPEYVTGLTGLLATQGENAVGATWQLQVAGVGIDCDGDDVGDAVGIITGLVQDCNRNLVPDSCEIAGGEAADVDGDGLLDGCPSLAVSINLPFSFGLPLAPISFGYAAIADWAGGPAAILRPVLKESSLNETTLPQFVSLAPPATAETSLSLDVWPWAQSWDQTPIAAGEGWFAVDVSTSSSPPVIGLAVFEPDDDGRPFEVARFDAATPMAGGLGASKAVFGGTLLAGSPYDAAGVFPIRRFERTERGWTEGAPIVVDDPAPATGRAIAFDGSTLAVSDQMPADEQFAMGRVRLFEREDDGSLVEGPSLRASVQTPGNGGFGASIHLEGDRLVVVSGVFSFGRVRIYRRVGADWLLEQLLSPFEQGGAGRSRIWFTGGRILIATEFDGIVSILRAANGAWIQELNEKGVVEGWRPGQIVATTSDGFIVTTAVKLGPPPRTAELWLFDRVVDCDENGISDRAQIAEDGSLDLDRNGRLDACELRGDMNLDGTIGPADLAIFLGRFGLGPGLGDLDDDGDVDSGDLQVLLSNWS